MNTSTHLLKEIVTKLIRNKKRIIVIGIICAILLFILAKISKPEYTSKATIFPLTNATENALSSTTLSNLLGISEAPKSFSGDASINIIELALSREVRENTAATRLQGKWGNKTIAEILIEEHNKGFSFFNKIKLPGDSVSLAVKGGELLYPDINARLNRNGVLELNYSNNNEELVEPISETIISKISQFYIDLRIKKATTDYNFTLIKVDSLQRVLDTIDRKAIHIQSTSLFTPGDKLQYTLPKDNLNDEKVRVGNEKNIAINNREEALWRLQKVTPIVETLDKPKPPFDVAKASGIIYAIVGFIIGIIIAILVLVRGLVYRYIKIEIHKAIFGEDKNSPEVVPAANS